MATIVEISSDRAPVVAVNAAYVAANISATYVEAEVQAVADQLVLTNTKLRELITDLQSIGVIKEA
jgi:hypothetical protein